MTVSAQTLAFEYAANGVTTTFPYGFRVLYADQVKVYVNGTLQVGGYTLTGVGDAGGGNVIFSVAPVNGSTVLVRRISDRVRSTDFQQAPYFTQEELLDIDQDYQTMLLQEAAADATNALRIPAVETSSVTLPDAADRANKAVVFDEFGNVGVSEDDYADQAAAAAASAAAALASENAAEAAAIAAEASADRVDLGALDQAVEDSEAARDIAIKQAGIATDQAVIATTQAGIATAAAVDAEAAAVAALAAAKTYTSTAAGIAATTSGQVFLVSTANPQVYSVYSNNAGSAVLLGTLNVADGTLIKTADTSPYVFVLADENGYIGLAVGENGEVQTALLDVSSELTVDVDGGVSTGMVTLETKNAAFKYAVVDGQENVILGVNEMGQLVANFDLVPIPDIPSTLKTGGTYDYDINHVFTYGQSLSVGQATPIQSPTQQYDNLMFFRGQRPQYDYPAEATSVWYQSLVPAIEFISPENSSLGETPSHGTGDMIKELVLAEDGKTYTDHTYQILTSAPGFGALTISALSKGSVHFTRMVDQVSFGLSLSNALGKTYAVQAVTWTQGESDYQSGTSRATYLASFNQLAADIQTDLKAASGQTKAIPVISYQVATHKTGGSATPTIALAQLDAEDANALIYIATPMYHLPYQDSFHLTGVGSKWLGAYYGLAYKRIVIDGVDWKPLKPISAVRQGTIVELRFNVPSGRLVFDTTQVTANTNMGFELVDSGGSPLTISSVAISDFDRVRIIASAAVPAGAKVRYAWSGAGNFGPVDGPRGNLRDTQGDDIVFDPTGINKRMDNWSVIFEMGV